jgi:hypothetical protein
MRWDITGLGEAILLLPTADIFPVQVQAVAALVI